MTVVRRYNKKMKGKKDIPCSAIIRDYDLKIGGLGKSDMLLHLYKTPTKARRRYLYLFGYLLDLRLGNSWLIYERDAIALKKKKICL